MRDVRQGGRRRAIRSSRRRAAGLTAGRRRPMMTAMFQRCARIFLEIVAVLILVTVAAAGLAAWRLSQGPVSLAQLTPYIDDALEGQLPGLHFRIGDTVVAWEGLSGGFGLRLRNVEVLTNAGTRVASVPDGSVSLSVTHLLSGR